MTLKATLLSLILQYFIAISIYGQAPTASFSIKPNACLNELLSVQDGSLNAQSEEWDFCENDFIQAPTFNTSLQVSSASSLLDIRVAQDQSNWFGFACDADGNKLIRLIYGNSPNNTPTAAKILDVPSPSGVDIVNFNGAWFGLVGTFNSPSQLYLLEFGQSLGNNPTISLINTPVNTFSQIRAIRITQEGSDLIAFVVNWSNSQVVRVNFGTSFTTNPVSVDFITLSGTNLIGIALQNDSNSKFAYVSDYGSNQISRLDFGSSWETSSPTISAVNDGGSLASPSVMESVFEGGKYYLLVTENAGSILRIDFGTDITNLNPSITDLGAFGDMAGIRGLSMARNNGSFISVLTSFQTNKAYTLNFAMGSCAASKQYVSSAGNQIVSFSNNGTYPVTLRVSGQGLLNDKVTKTVVISSVVAPDITIQITNNQCLGLPNEFALTSSQVINTYNWDLGDGAVSSNPAPTYLYPAEGRKIVNVQVTAANNCQNIVTDTITVFSSPDFSLPSGTICNNQSYLFQNNTTFDTSFEPTWQWSVNSVNVTTAQNMNYFIPATGTQTITLKASNSECSNQITHSINSIQQGALVDFTTTGNCQSDAIQFTNQTNASGTTISSYAWTFGDSNTSSATDAQNTYSAIGTYDVTLVANNTVGCSNSATKSLTIYTKPQPDFSLDLPPFSCNGSLSQFHDLTPAPTDSNISGWSWNFGDGTNVLGSTKNPTYTYAAAGNYTVSFTATSNFGCSNTIQKSVTISQSPVTAFTNTAACVNQAVQFTDTSTGSIRARQWKIQNINYTSATPSVTFNVPGTYPVQLTETGNNNCVNVLVKNIVVPVPPTLDFTVTAPCINNSSVFTEVNPGGSDPSASWNWDFGGQGTGTGSPAQFSFPTTGTYSVKMTVTRQSGCVYALSKSLTIGDSPKALFSASVTSGPAPLAVDFNNTSSLATAYLWSFNDANNSTSSDASPSFTFNDLGTYNVSLTASNIVGCISIFSLPIYVVNPEFDVVMKDFYFVKDPSTGSLKAVVTVLNKSNLPITNPEITLDLAGVSSVRGTLNGTVLPNQSLVQTLGFDIIPMTATYACAEVDVTGDTDLFDNKKCVSLNNDEVLFTPFPNPAQSQINMQWISTDSEDVRVTIYNATGQVTYDQLLVSPTVGLNQLQISTTPFSAGVYFMQFTSGKIQKTFRFAVAGN